jgi:hypothetical protein
MIDLAPVSVRRLVEIQLIRPAIASKVNLAKDAISWAPVPEAPQYEVTLGYFTDLPHPSSNWFHSISTDKTDLVPAELSGRDCEAMLREWIPGRTAGVQIQARNAEGQRIAVTLKERQFLVVSGPKD